MHLINKASVSDKDKQLLFPINVGRVIEPLLNCLKFINSINEKKKNIQVDDQCPSSGHLNKFDPRTGQEIIGDVQRNQELYVSLHRTPIASEVLK